ncbi:MAG: DNA methyltransferase [Patescibacteria group bacterium]
MNENFYTKLEKLLKKDNRFIDQDGDLLKSEVIDKAYKVDEKLIEFLISDKDVKNKFFSKIKDVHVFNINDFVSYIQDKHFLNDSYTKYKNKIGLTIDGKFLKERDEVALVWPFKDCVLEGGMTKEDQKRKEIFFNEILAQDEIDKLLAPKVLTNWKRYTQDGEKEVKELKRDKDGTINENLIIKGNNLLALHSLKQEFQGKVKLIYIDPPYNTGGGDETFTYNNNFKHSTWLTFMKNRLEIARNFLTENGFISIAIDHYEMFYLGALCDEIYGRENRLGVISVVHNAAGRSDDKFFATSNEYMFVYAKNWQKCVLKNFEIGEKQLKTFKYNDDISKYRLIPLIKSGVASTRNARPKQFYPIYINKKLDKVYLSKNKNYVEVLPIDKNGIERVWRNSPARLSEKIKNNEIVIKKDANDKIVIYYKHRITDYKGVKPKTHWEDPKYNASTYGTKLLANLIGEGNVSFPKSIYTVIDLLKITTDKQDLILDFFSGSATTAHAVLELNKIDNGNRKYILIEQLERHLDTGIKRIVEVMKKFNKEKTLFNKKSLDFIYCELMKYNEAFIDNIQTAKDANELLKIWGEMKEKSFLNYNVDLKRFDETIDEFKKCSLNKQKEVLLEILNKNQLYVNLSEMGDGEFKVTQGDRGMNEEFYRK